jgi:hypothetical protein
MKCFLLPVLFCMTIILFTTVAKAERPFGSAMKKHYRLRSVSCYTCHVKGEEKEVVNPFGKTVGKLIDDKKFGEKIAIVKEASLKERLKVNEEVEKEFIAALKKLDKLKSPSGKTYAEAITAGEIEGIKLYE